MKNKLWKYLWAWSEEFVNCGGQGAGAIKASIKMLKDKGFDCKIRVGHSCFVGQTLIEIYCKDLKTKRAIQEELYQNQYISKRNDYYAWEKIIN